MKGKHIRRICKNFELYDCCDLETELIYYCLQCVESDIEEDLIVDEVSCNIDHLKKIANELDGYVNPKQRSKILLKELIEIKRRESIESDCGIDIVDCILLDRIYNRL